MNDGLVGLFGALAAGGVKSIQKGVISGSLTQTPTASITPVNTAKSLVLVTGVSAASSSAVVGDLGVIPSFVSETQIQFAGGYVPGVARSIGWIVIELK